MMKIYSVILRTPFGKSLVKVQAPDIHSAEAKAIEHELSIDSRLSYNHVSVESSVVLVFAQ